MSAPLKIIWTKEEDDHFLALILQGYQIGKIAESVGRPRSTVGQRIRALIRQMDPREQMKYREQKMVPQGNPPALQVDQSKQIMRGWTPEMDARIIELRGLGWSYKRIGKEVHKGDTSVNDRLIKLQESGKFKRDPAEKRVLWNKESQTDCLKRPIGPAPENPAPPRDPRKPGWRRCLGDNCGRVFWSPSAAVRRCEKCKKLLTRSDEHGNGARVDDRLEMCLHL